MNLELENLQLKKQIIELQSQILQAQWNELNGRIKALETQLAEPEESQLANQLSLNLV